MRAAWRPLTYAILSTTFVLLLSACGLVVNDPGFFGSSDAATVSIKLTGPATVMLGAQSQYSATISGSSDAAVTWSVDGVAGGNQQTGSISSAGLFTAPVAAPKSGSVTITATSVSHPKVSQSLPITLTVPPPSSNQTGGPTVALTLSGPVSVTLGSTAQYTASITGSSNTGVSWSVNGVIGGNDTVGLITATGLYTAPSAAPSAASVTITATSLADSSVSQSLAITLDAPVPPPPSVTLALSGPSSVMLGASAQYSATVTGTNNTGVAWSVNGVPGGSAHVGFINSTGLYTAPASAPQSSNITITATSLADSSVSQSLSVALTSPPPPPPPAVTLTVSGAKSVTLGTTAQYTATVSGSSNKQVAWSVNGIAGGDSTVGSISANGLYRAPASMPDSSNVTITATSAADSSVSESVSVTLTAPAPPPPSVSLTLSGARSVTLGTTSQYTATVSGSSNKQITWSVNGIAGGNSTVGSISANGFYKAPATMPRSSSLTIKATSVADSSVSRSLTVTLIAPPPPQPSVTIALSGATTVMLGATSQYSAVVTGTSDTAVSWSVNGIAGGNASVGRISTGGSYTAPGSEPSSSSKVTITATSQADNSVSQDLIVTLTTPPAPPKITVTLSGPTSVALSASARYTATVTGSSNTAVTWSVNGVVGGESSIGTISPAGLYTAPDTMPQASKVTITATSLADSAVSQSLSVTLTLPPPPPKVSVTVSGANKVTLGTTAQYKATVTGSSNTSVTWSVNGVTGGNATNGTITAGGLYAAPTVAPQPSTVTIAATSVADSTAASSLVVTLTAPSSRIPSNAVASSDLNASTKWSWNHDAGTPGTSQGTTTYPVAGMSGDNAARKFYMTYSARGGEIYHLSFARDTAATHFVYDTYVYVDDPLQLANLEMDMNDVTADGRTMILGTQCSTYSKSWEYTLYSSGGFHWHPSNIPCDPLQWSPKTWHHFQIASHRDNSGNATYDWVSVDGKYSDFAGASGYDSASLGWAIGTLLINFQIDGYSKTSGSNTLYTDKFMVWRW